MVTKFKVNRPLTEMEMHHRLSVRQVASATPLYAVSVIKLNSTYVESVDKWYGMRGYVAMGGCAFTAILLCIAVAWAYFEVKGGGSALFLLGPAAAFAMSGLTAWFFLRDAFTYTHYPIRFNRKNRSVYVWRRDGTVLKAPWDQIYFTICGHGTGFNDLYVAGHVLAEDRNTVLETFALSLVTSGQQGEANLRSHFEFYRRYMEQGPSDELLAHTRAHWLPPLDERREGFWWGCRIAWSTIGRLPLLAVIVAPITAVECLFRWLVMRTSKIPRWPDAVEAECAVATNDPWVRDARRH